MTRFEFGPPIDDDDILVVQGIEYPMAPVGLRAMRRLLTLRNTMQREREDEDRLTEEDLDVALEIVVHAVRPEVRDKFKEHIEDSVGPELLVQIATAVMESFSDLGPTQPESSSGGSSPTGSDSTDGASPVESTPTT